MYRGYQFIIAHIVMRCCTVEPQIATYQLSVYHVLYQDPKGELCLICWLEMSWRFWMILEGDAPWFEMQQSIARRLWASHLAEYFAGFNDNDFFQPCGRSKIGPRVQPEVEKNFEARQPRWRYQILVAAWQRFFFVLHTSGVSFTFRYIAISQC